MSSKSVLTSRRGIEVCGGVRPDKDREGQVAWPPGKGNYFVVPGLREVEVQSLYDGKYLCRLLSPGDCFKVNLWVFVNDA